MVCLSERNKHHTCTKMIWIITYMPFSHLVAYFTLLIDFKVDKALYNVSSDSTGFTWKVGYLRELIDVLKMIVRVISNATQQARFLNI